MGKLRSWVAPAAGLQQAECLRAHVGKCVLGNTQQHFGRAKPGLRMAAGTQACGFVRARSRVLLAPW